MVCSILVSVTVVSLDKIRQENEKRTRLGNIFIDLEILREGESVKDMMERTQFLLIDLETGEEIQEERYAETLNPKDFDVKNIADKLEFTKDIPEDKDIAGIRRKPKYMAVYWIYHKGEPNQYLFPVYGRGLYSTLYGFIALGSDLRTIEGITFYEHGETPGLGGEVDNPEWKRSWRGKQAFDKDGNLQIEVIKGRVDPSKLDAKYKIDGLSGATYTTRGVDQLVKFWLGSNGFGPFLERLRKELPGGQV
jgi:Na+-transporting NADH:ubiquinone oxidoreductase subunit C